MTDAHDHAPVVSEDAQAAMMAAMARIESVPARKNFIDTMSDEEWLSDEPDMWLIDAGSLKGEDEIDSLDKDVSGAA